MGLFNLKDKIIFVPAGLVLLGVLIYFNSLHGEFHFDDYYYVRDNTAIRDITDLGTVFTARDMPARAVTFLTFALNYHVYGNNVLGYHVVNLVIHLLVSCCVWWLTLLTLRAPRLSRSDLAGDKHLIAAGAAFLFLAHPVQTQAVSYITQRFASLAALFYLFAVCCYARARLGRNMSSRVTFYVIAFVSALLGMFTKQTVLTLPLTVLLFELYFFKSGQSPGGARPRVFLVSLLSLMLVVPWLYDFDVGGKIFEVSAPSKSHGGDVITAASYLMTQPRVIATYLRLIFFPLGQNLDYDFPLTRGVGNIPFIVSALLIAFLIWAAVIARKKHPLVSFGLVWFFVTLAVESSFIPIAQVIFEHRCYLPSAGLFIALSAGLYSAMRNKKRVVAVLAVLVVTMSWLTHQRNNVWRTEVSLWSDAVQKSPRKVRPYLHYGVALIDRGEYPQAVSVLERALDLKTADEKETAKLYLNRGIAFHGMEEYHRALSDYRRASREDPNLKAAYFNQSTLFTQAGEYRHVISVLDQMIKAHPGEARAFRERGEAYHALNHLGRAVTDYTSAISADPTDVQSYLARGDARVVLGEYEAALLDYDHALTIDPLKVKAFIARGDLYRAQGNMDLALNDYSRAISIDEDDPKTYLKRGKIYLQEERDVNKAIEDFNRVIALSPYNGLGFYYRGLAYVKMNERSLAYRDLQKARQLGQNVNEDLLQGIREKGEGSPDQGL